MTQAKDQPIWTEDPPEGAGKILKCKDFFAQERLSQESQQERDENGASVDQRDEKAFSQTEAFGVLRLSHTLRIHTVTRSMSGISDVQTVPEYQQAVYAFISCICHEDKNGGSASPVENTKHLQKTWCQEFFL